MSKTEVQSGALTIDQKQDEEHVGPQATSCILRSSRIASVPHVYVADGDNTQQRSRYEEDLDYPLLIE